MWTDTVPPEHSWTSAEEKNLQVPRDNLEGSSDTSLGAYPQLLKMGAQRGLMTCPSAQSERCHLEARLRPWPSRS